MTTASSARHDTIPNVVVDRLIPASRDRVFAWLADSRNFSRASMVFACPWARSDADGGYGVGAIRNVFMVAGWYREEITRFEPGRLIGYRVLRSVPPVRQEHSVITLSDHEGGTRVVWEVAMRVRVPVLGSVLTKLSAPVAQRLYGTIVDAAAHDLSAA